LWIAEKHRAATHDRIATQRILSVPTTDGSSRLSKARTRRHALRPRVRSALSRRLNAADSLPKERRRVGGSNPSNLSVSFQTDRNFAIAAKWSRKIENAFIGVNKP
jgi:hypothetical protein